MLIYIYFFFMVPPWGKESLSHNSLRILGDCKHPKKPSGYAIHYIHYNYKLSKFE